MSSVHWYCKEAYFLHICKDWKKKCKAKITKIQISVFYHSFSLKTNFTQYNNQKWRRSKSEKKNLFSKSVFHDVTHAMLVWRTNMRKLNSFLVMAFFFTIELVKLLVTWIKNALYLSCYHTWVPSFLLT